MKVSDPWASKANLRWWLQKLKEDNELDWYIETYIDNILCQKIYARPSKGPYGEQGKDIVAIENENTGDYCSYIIKRGNLHKNLDGCYGVMKQMEDAMMIELEEGKYKGKKRTAIVVYNGVEGNRVAIGKFEKKRESIEQAIGNKLLLRPIERWDINEITKRLFPHGKHFKKLEEYNMTLERMYAAVEIITDIKENVESFMFNGHK
jgi:hypothetical protein